MSNLTFRLKSFLYEIGTLAAVALTGFILSPEFQSLFARHFGEFAIAGIAFPILIAVVKQVRNSLLANKVGAAAAHHNRI